MLSAAQTAKCNTVNKSISNNRAEQRQLNVEIILCDFDFVIHHILTWSARRRVWVCHSSCSASSWRGPGHWELPPPGHWGASCHGAPHHPGAPASSWPGKQSGMIGMKIIKYSHKSWLNRTLIFHHFIKHFYSLWR